MCAGFVPGERQAVVVGGDAGDESEEADQQEYPSNREGGLLDIRRKPRHRTGSARISGSHAVPFLRVPERPCFTQGRHGQTTPPTLAQDPPDRYKTVPHCASAGELPGDKQRPSMQELIWYSGLDAADAPSVFE